jgi:hypothetical protein
MFHHHHHLYGLGHTWSVPSSWRLCCLSILTDHLCGLVVRVPDYRSRGTEFDSRHYQIFWEVVGLERGPLSLVSIIEELLGRNISGCGDPLRWPRDTLYLQKLALTSPASGGRSVGKVCLQTKAMEFVCIHLNCGCCMFYFPLGLCDIIYLFVYLMCLPKIYVHRYRIRHHYTK